MSKKALSLILALSMILSVISAVPLTVGARTLSVGDIVTSDDFAYSDGAYHIYTALGLVYFSEITQNAASPYLGATVYLENDVDVSDYDAQINIGTKDVPFFGVFDGRFHTITGLTFTGENSPYAGLFAYTNDGGVGKPAQICNLVIEDANIKSARQGGILVGWAQNTVITNCVIRNSKLEMYTNGAVIELITALGISGGLMVGTAVDTGFYNCEVENSNICVNQVGGVQALGGDGLYLGGLVGYSSGSVIEYSRVLGGKVDLEFNIAVAALGAKILYSGGIVGGIDNGTRVIDCFSTADVNFKTEVYVGVGAGTTGYAAGIAGMALNGSSVERCHYAGSMSSRLYQVALLFIPGYWSDTDHQYGIVGYHDGNITVTKCYYDYDKIQLGTAENKRKNLKQVAVRGEENRSEFTSIDHMAYSTQSLWEECDYDFEGTTERESGNKAVNDPHINKWVMDYENEMPIHGNGVTVAIDFPKVAGKVMVGETLYRRPIVFDEGSVTQMASVTDTHIALSANAFVVNEGYRFVGWYWGYKDEEGNIKIGHKDENGNIIEGYDGNLITNEAEYSHPIKDNDIIVAHYQARVEYTDKTENEIVHSDWYNYEEELRKYTPEEINNFKGWNEEKAYPEATTAEISHVIKFVKPGIPVKNCMKLYPVYLGMWGATDGNGNAKVMFEATATNLYDIEGLGHSVSGEEWTARGGFATNVRKNDEENWIVTYDYFDDFENRNDASLITDRDNEPNYYIFDGWYRVKRSDLVKRDEDGSVNLSNVPCLSRNRDYVLKDGELAEDFVYIAKFKYKVVAWQPVMEYNAAVFPATTNYYYANRVPHKDIINESKYIEVWVDYGTTADALCGGSDSIIPQPSGKDFTFQFWTDNLKDDGDLTASHRAKNYLHINELIGAYEAYSGIVKSPGEIFAVSRYSGGVQNGSITLIDFPGSATIEWTSPDYKINLNNKYNVFGMNYHVTYYAGNTGSEVDSDSQKLNWKGSVPGEGYWKPINNIYYKNDYQNVVELRAAADINFYDKSEAWFAGENLLSSANLKNSYKNSPNNSVATTATRKYRSKLFGEATPEAAISEIPVAEEHQPAKQNVPFGLGNVLAGEGTLTYGASSENTKNMNLLNYKFLGWVDRTQMRGARSENENNGKSWEELYLYEEDFGASKQTVLDEYGRPDNNYNENGKPDYYVTADSAKAEGYVLTDDDRVYSHMEIYPLYARYDVFAKTNVDSRVNDGYNYGNSDVNKLQDLSVGCVPLAPVFRVEDNLGVGNNGDLISDGAEAVDNSLYPIHRLRKVELIESDARANYDANSPIIKTWVANPKLFTQSGAIFNDFTFTQEDIVDVDKYYVLKAYYGYDVTYHLSKAEGDVKVLERTYDDEAVAKDGLVGKTFDPHTKAPANKIFVGWASKNDPSQMLPLTESADLNSWIVTDELAYEAAAPDNGEYFEVESYSDLETLYMVDVDTKVQRNLHLYPVYSGPNIIVNSNIDDKPVTHPIAEYKAADGVVQLIANNKIKEGYEFAHWTMTLNGKTTDFSIKSKPNLTANQAFSGATFTAVYNPIITYMIPDVNGDEITYDENGNYTESTELGEKIKLSSTAIGSVNAAVKGTNFTFGGWSLEEDSHTPIDVNTVVDGPMTLWPILNPSVVVTYEWTVEMGVNTNGTEKDDVLNSESLKFTTDNDGNVVVNASETGAVDNILTLKEALPNYTAITEYEEITDDSGNVKRVPVITEYRFIGWEEQTEEKKVYDGEAEYPVTQTVKFVALWETVTVGKEITVWSNFRMNKDASDTKNMKLRFEVTGEYSIFPYMDEVAELAPGTSEKGVTFVGYALVSMGGEGDADNTLDGLYPAGGKISTETIYEYGLGDGSEKRIYAVWAQVKTVAKASVRLDDLITGLRVMGEVNTTVLERVGLRSFDQEYSKENKGVYKRAMLFATDNVIASLGSNFANSFNANMKGKHVSIEAVTRKWYGEEYHLGEFNISRDRFENPKSYAFSIVGNLGDASNYGRKVAFRSYLEFTYENGKTKKTYGTFDKSDNIRSVQEIAQSYLEKIESMQGQEGLSDDAMARLREYAGAEENGGNE